MRAPRPFRIARAVRGAAGFAALCTAAATAQVPDPSVPSDTEGIGIFEHPGVQVPLDLRFTDDAGRAVTLGDYFRGDRPVLLLLVYYRCPGICNALLNGLAETLRELEWSAGDQFRIVTVSIDPQESHELAGNKKQGYLGWYNRPSAADGWAFLVGEQASITALADAVGFGYRWEERTGQYTHAASLMVCTPKGRLSRYLNNVVFEPGTLRLALTEASEGTIGTPVHQLLLKWCYMYDPSSGRYVIAARKVMTIGGLVTVVLTGAGLAFLWWRDVGSRRPEAHP